jgi:hypothetical protein
MKSTIKPWFKSFLLFIPLFCFGFSGLSQNLNVLGVVQEEKSGEPLLGVTARALNAQDSSLVLGSTSNQNGEFFLRDLPQGNFLITLSFIGFETIYYPIENTNGGFRNLGKIKMAQDAKLLKEVEIKDLQTRSVLKGDTTEFNADAFKTNPDANAEDLVRKMPGVTLEGGQVKAQGEEVKRVLVNGREFFGDDARTALQTLPSNIIQGVQVYDQQSDQARLTGFDDGNSNKVLNIITKPGMSVGTFGRVYGGYGTDNRYQAGGNINFFKDKRKITILGLSNNINDQNFSGEDLAGIASGGGGRGRWRRSGNEYNFITGNQSGINVSNSYGINYSDEFGKLGSTISLSYFYNRVDNTTENALQREFFLQAEDNNFYNENRLATSLNNNHRVNGRFEFKLDSNNTIIVAPRISFGNRRSTDTFNGLTFIPTQGNLLVNQTESSRRVRNLNYNINNTLTYQHKFAKEGRTISINVDTEFNEQDGESFLNSNNIFFQSNENEFLDQFALNENYGQNIGARVNYTEPLGKDGQLQLSVGASERISKSDQKTNNFNASDAQYSILDTLLSNEFINNLQTGIVGFNYRKKLGKHNLTLGADYEQVNLFGEQTFPFAAEETRVFNNLLPNATWFYNINRTKSIRLFYRSRTRTPGIGELQNVIDNSNPIFLSSGNPDLDQSVTHSIFTRYFSTNTEKGRTFFAFISGSHQIDFIGNTTFIATQDTSINNVLLRRGGQFSRPENLDGFWNFRTYVSLGLPFKLIKSNINFNAGSNYTRTPSIINGQTNLAENFNFNGGVTLSSNISENLDFTLTLNPNYNIVLNSVQPELNNNFYSQLTGLKFNWIFGKGFVLSSDVNHTLFTGLGSEFNQNFFLWNAGLGYKFLKNKMGDLRIVVFDLLNQNNSILRNVTETYVEDNETRVLQQFFMLQFTYTFRSFKGGMKDPTKDAPEIRQWGR